MKVLAVLALPATALAFVVPAVPRTRCNLPARAIAVPNPPAEGEREIVDGPDGPVIVAQVGGEYYAIDALCPHLGLPMKRGKIIDGPQLVCNFHGSTFDMETGACTKWITGALGFQNDFVAGLMSKGGNPKSDTVAYEVTKLDDGSLELSKKE